MIDAILSEIDQAWRPAARRGYVTAYLSAAFEIPDSTVATLSVVRTYMMMMLSEAVHVALEGGGGADILIHHAAGEGVQEDLRGVGAQGDDAGGIPPSPPCRWSVPT